jgi:hypothetical protein
MLQLKLLQKDPYLEEKLDFIWDYQKQAKEDLWGLVGIPEEVLVEKEEEGEHCGVVQLATTGA